MDFELNSRHQAGLCKRGGTTHSDFLLFGQLESHFVSKNMVNIPKE